MDDIVSPARSIEAFRTAMAAKGIATDDRIIGDGRLHRIHVEGDRKGTRHGWYVLHLDAIPAGAFGSWRFGVKKTWRFSAPGVQGDAASRQWITETAKQRDEDEARRRERARSKAERIWTNAKPPPADHTYLVQKRAKPHSLRMSCGPRKRLSNLNVILTFGSRTLVNAVLTRYLDVRTFCGRA